MMQGSEQIRTLMDVVRERAARTPQQRAYTFLTFQPERIETSLTIGQLDAAAREISVRLLTHANRHDRALLLYRPGLEFIRALMGCLYSGVIAVPVPVPKLGKGAARLEKIIADAGARVVLSTRSVCNALRPLVAGAQSLNWLLTDEIEAAAAAHWQPPTISAQDIAFLQYSSGSTGDPKGVMISHANLMHQAGLLTASFRAAANSCSIYWLPVLHDLGLIGGVLQPLHDGFHGMQMAPESFVEKPLRWLQAISDLGVDMSAAPSFAYEMCVRSITPADAQRLDLSNWRYAMNGAEPIRVATMERFVEKFAACGFRREAFYRAYGLAEATLMVSGGHCDHHSAGRSFDSNALRDTRVVPVEAGHEAAILLSPCGKPLGSQTVRIVDPETLQPRAAMQTGEIWIAGPSVSSGYWQRSEATAATFIPDPQTGERFLRSGDIGFLCDDELFVCGRLKDLILIRGRNHHPSDIEHTVESSHPALRPFSCAAFSIEAQDEEQLVVVQELERQFATLESAALHEIAAIAAQRIVEEHEINVRAVVFIRHGTLPKTSSGKIQRRECRMRYLDDKLKVILSWSAAVARVASIPESLPEKALADIERWLVERIAEALRCNPGAVSVHAPVKQSGLTPSDTLQLISKASTAFGTPLPVTLFEDFPCIRDVATLLAQRGVCVGGHSRQRSVESLAAASHAPAASCHEPIAIVGMSCRFPGAPSLQEFWRMLCEGRDAVAEVPQERWDIDELYDSDPLAIGKMNTRRGGFIANIDQLDRHFFGLSIREAVRIDPQHRLMLELAWEALEDAGIVPEQLSDSPTGVFVGISGSDYAQMQFSDPTLSDAYAGLGCALTIAASRVSHFLDLRGPAFAIDTACSSSLSALHLACGSIRQGECTMAIAAGVNILLSPIVTMCLSKAGMMSPDGRCKAFDSRANGYVRAEGGGVVILKPLSRAIADGDSIYAVVRGTASNQDGRSSGIAAPNGEAQQRVVLAACSNAGIAPGDLDYVEAHGTGTAVGDPVEVNALGAVLALNRAPGTHCAIGSVKTNIGHAESAAGMASVIKTALMLRHRQIPPSLHFDSANPLIPFAGLPLKVQTVLGPMPLRDRGLLAGVNGFGVGGTNVHVVLEQAPPLQSQLSEQPAGERVLILPLSARSANALKARAMAMAHHLRSLSGEDRMRDIAYTLSVCRAHMNHRVAATGSTRSELAEALESYANTGHHPAVASGFVPVHAGRSRLAFVFSGQGSQWWGMGRELFKSDPVFRETLERCDALLRARAGWSLIEALHAPEHQSRLQETVFAQPAIFAVQTGIAAVLRAQGINPDAVVGHSVGEISAAHCAGMLCLEDAIALIEHRGRLMQRVTGAGCMTSVSMPLAELEPLLEPYSRHISVAAINSPTAIVLSGSVSEMGMLTRELEQRGVVTAPLPVNYAFHSPQMERLKHELVAGLSAMQSQPASIPMLSTVTAEWCAGVDGPYWGENMRQPVLFADAIAKLARSDIRLFMEIGPHPVVAGAMSRTITATGSKATVIATLRREQSDQHSMAQAFAGLYCAGHACDWGRVCERGRVHQPLPTYPWDRQRLWLEMPNQKRRRTAGRHPLLNAPLPTAEPSWQVKVDQSALPQAKALRVNGRDRLPNGLLLELALAVAHDGFAPALHELAHVELAALTANHSDQSMELQAMALRPTRDECRVQLFVLADAGPQQEGEWRMRLSAQPVAARTSHDESAVRDVAVLKALCSIQVDLQEFYNELALCGYEYDSALRISGHAQRSAGAALLMVALEETATPLLSRYRMHPLAFEAAEHAVRLAIGSKHTSFEMARVRSVRVLQAASRSICVYARLRGRLHACEDSPYADVWIGNEEGETVAVLEGVGFRPVELAAQRPHRIPEHPAEWLYDVRWQPARRANQAATKVPAGALWVVLADQGGVGHQMAARLHARGDSCVLVHRAAEFARVSRLDYRVAADQPEHLRRVFSEVLAGATHCAGVVHLWSLDASEPEKVTASSIMEAQQSGAVAVLHVVQGLAATALHRPPRLYTVTRNTQSAGPAAGPVRLSDWTIWGLAKVIAIEHPELRCCRIDLGADDPAADASELCEELWADGPDDQIALRGKDRYGARLVRREAASSSAAAAVEGAAPRDRPFRLEWPVDTTGSVRLLPEQRHAPGADQVEIRVQACGLEASHARGVATGMTPAAMRWQTQGCAGRVLRVGPGVTQFAVGDEVLAITGGDLASHLVTKTHAVTHMPRGWSAERAASTPRPFLAALYGLRELAALKRGERILVLGADSSVGSAVLQVARWLGADIIVSAATPAAREQLESGGTGRVCASGLEPGIEEVQALAPGGALDVIVNCLGQATDLSNYAALLTPWGRAVDLAAGSQRSAATLQRFFCHGNASMHMVDVALLLRSGGRYVQQLLTEVVARLNDGTWHAQTVAVQELQQLVEQHAVALQDLQSTAIRLPAADAAAEEVRSPFRGDCTYLLTGGLGGLGLCIARRMVQRGARHIVLLGRREPSVQALQQIQDLQSGGAHIVTRAADISDEQQVRDVLSQIRAHMPPLGGIVHAAGVLENGLLINLDAQRFCSVMPSKVMGAWHLHHHTAADTLDFFVMFSSLASLIGSPGQGNYAAANGFLDGLAELRRQRGLPGLSIAWGPWTQVGMAADVHNEARLEAVGHGMLLPEKALDVLEDAIQGQQGWMGAIAMNWPVWSKAYPIAAGQPFISALIPAQPDVLPTSTGRLTAPLLMQLTAEQRIERLQHAVHAAVCHSLRLEPDHLQMDISLSAVGLDSIVALELKGRIEASVDAVVQTAALLKGPTVQQLALQLATQIATGSSSKLPAVERAQTAAPAKTDQAAQLLDQLDSLSDSEVSRLLSDLMAN